MYLQKLTGNGEIENLFSEQLFYLEMWNGWNYGSLYSAATGQNGEYIEYAPREFFLIANDSIDVDTAEVEIYVETEYGTEGGSPSIIEENSTNRNVYKSLSKLNKKSKRMKQARENKIVLSKTSLPGNSVTSLALLTGIGKLMIAKNDSLKLEITMVDSKEIWPLLPSAQNKLSGYDPTTNIKVSVT